MNIFLDTKNTFIKRGPPWGAAGAPQISPIIFFINFHKTAECVGVQKALLPSFCLTPSISGPAGHLIIINFKQKSILKKIFFLFKPIHS